MFGPQKPDDQAAMAVGEGVIATGLTVLRADPDRLDPNPPANDAQDARLGAGATDLRLSPREERRLPARRTLPEADRAAHCERGQRRRVAPGRPMRAAYNRRPKQKQRITVSTHASRLR